MGDILIKNIEVPETCVWRDTKDGRMHSCFLVGKCRSYNPYTFKVGDDKPKDCMIKEIE